MSGMPQVLLIDSHEDFRQEVRRFLEPEFEVVGMVSEWRAAREVMRQLRPDVVVIDMLMPFMGGVEAATRLLQCSSSVNVVFLSSHYSQSLIQKVLSAGALGYVYKASAVEDLGQAIWAAIKGRVFISPSPASAYSSLPAHH